MVAIFSVRLSARQCCFSASMLLAACTRAFASADEDTSAVPTTPVAAGVSLVEGFRDSLADTLDASSRWVDQFFGPQRFTDEAPGANGRLMARVVWREYRGFRIDTRLSAKLPLENLHHRLNAFLRKGQVDDVVQDKVQTPSVRVNEVKDKWLLGLGYVPPWGNKSQPYSLSAGVELDWPLDPFVRAGYRYEHALSSSVLVRVAPGVFWKESEQFGATASVDFDWRLNDKRLIRFPNWFKMSGSTEKLEYDSRALWMENLRDGQAIMGGFAIQGDTGAKVALRQYGVYAVYRRRLYKDWLTGEIIAGAGMLRMDDWTERKFSLAGGIGVELSFEKKRTKSAAFDSRMLRSLRQ